GIAWIDGSISLNEKAEIAYANMRACQGRDNAGCRGLPHAEGISDRQHQIANGKPIRIAKLDDRELLVSINLQHGKIDRFILKENARFKFATIGERHTNLVRIPNYMLIGDDQAGRVDQHARTQRGLHARRKRAAEESVKEWIAEEG